MSRRVVSLVPSLTEAVASVGADLLVGATDWCSHPTDLDVARIGGTKNPRVGQIVALRPDVVLANSEENRVPDLQALREAGVDVWLTGFETVPEALSGLAEMLRSLGLGSPDWLEAAWESWRQPWERPRLRGLVPIWRRPWMALGRDTFAGDVLSRVGLDNVLMSDPERYPKIDLTALPPYDVVVLPDEPYAFSAADGPECFQVPAALVSGRHLTWYGPSLAQARAVLEHSLWG